MRPDPTCRPVMVTGRTCRSTVLMQRKGAFHEGE